MILLTDTNHSNPVHTMNGDAFLFVKGENLVLSDNPGLTSIFGCPAKVVSYKKRTWNKAELWWAETYNDSKPTENKIWAVYKVDWTQFTTNKEIAGTSLLKGSCVSSNSLSDASIALFAVDVKNNKVVSYTHTSYWKSDANDESNWEKSLFQRFGKVKELAAV